MATSTSKVPAESAASSGAASGGAAAGVAELSFEQAAQELESLVEDMENNVLPLEQMLASYERGVLLAQQCTKRLSDAEKRIEIIKRMPDGHVTMVPLDPETAESAAPPASSSTTSAAARSRGRSGSSSAPAPASASTAHDDADADDDDDNELSLF